MAIAALQMRYCDCDCDFINMTLLEKNCTAVIFDKLLSLNSGSITATLSVIICRQFQILIVTFITIYA